MAIVRDTSMLYAMNMLISMFSMKKMNEKASMRNDNIEIIHDNLVEPVETQPKRRKISISALRDNFHTDDSYAHNKSEEKLISMDKRIHWRSLKE